ALPLGIISAVKRQTWVDYTVRTFGGPDPLARRYDFSKNPLEYAKEQERLIERFRKRLMTDYVQDGDSWTKAREGYELTLNLQMKFTSMMSNWIGGAFINRDKKGDPKQRLPIEVVPAKTQREALAFVLESTFRDSAYALSPELLARLTKDFMDGFGAEPAWPVHDRILSMQASTLTQLMRTTTLRRVYDNEFRTPEDQDALTLPELLDSITSEIWSELDAQADGEAKYTTRKPMTSSLRRNLQREHLERLIDLTLASSGSSAAYKAISNLCIMELQELKEKIASKMKSEKALDPYTKAHLYEANKRIEKALDAEFVYNQAAAPVLNLPFLLGDEADEEN
ncbi:MAG: zinc-dependent metalloprotease, partial [Planctomycetota bacterium]